MSVQKLDSKVNANGLRVGIVAARFNEIVVKSLTEGALETLLRLGCSDSDITLVHVPGCFEVPLACRKMAESGQYDAVIALGAVIRGDTSHYDHVCSRVTDGVGRVSDETGVPVALGVITTENLEQALDRSGGKAGNKGSDAAMVAVEMACLVTAISRRGKNLKVSVNS
ncbi:MAG: 6,7-dimethyl-8-ribityllumazine synthase [Bdellovibrionales bacterium]|nr:6,7-dimethyl-8-ribityllumazine synthase [Bdellovibrionales bacterium]